MCSTLKFKWSKDFTHLVELGIINSTVKYSDRLTIKSQPDGENFIGMKACNIVVCIDATPSLGLKFRIEKI